MSVMTFRDALNLPIIDSTGPRRSTVLVSTNEVRLIAETLENCARVIRSSWFDTRQAAQLEALAGTLWMVIRGMGAPDNAPRRGRTMEFVRR